MKPFGVSNGRAGRLLITGDNIRVPPKTALALGIAFHELATNAAKYGAFSNEHGSISITWSIQPGSRRLVLHWTEKGGPRVSPPTRKGFGSRVLMRGLAHELEAKVELDYRVEGLSCTIDMPSPENPRDQ